MEERNEIIRKKVEKSADFMAPYFLLDRDNLHFYALDLKVMNNGNECSYRLDNVMFLPEDANDSDIGHEIGHWFHRIINPEGFNFALHFAPHNSIVYQYLETIADYGESINCTSGQVVKDENLKPHLKFLATLPRINCNKLYEFLETEKEKLHSLHNLLNKYVKQI